MRSPGNLALELGEREQHVERQAPHGGRRIELLRHRHKGCIVRIEDVDDLGEIGKRPGQPVDLTWGCSSQGGVLDSVAREENSVGCCGIQGLSPIP